MEFGRGLQLISSLTIGALVGGAVTYLSNDVAGVIIGICVVFLAVRIHRRVIEG